MDEKQKIEKMNKSYKGIFKALEGLTNAEAITQLEAAKIDIILNNGIIKLDGKSGKVY